MHLCDFNISNLRCISQTSVELDKGINLIIGENGSGKTSFLEGIYLLATGKSFSAVKRRDLIRDGTCRMGVAGVFVSSFGLESKIKLEKSYSETNYTLQGQSVRKTSDVAAKIPILVGNSRAADLLTDSPKARRDLLDRTAFHVKPSFLSIWQELRRALAQRNNVLKSGYSSNQLCYWDKLVSEKSNEMDAYRKEIVDKVNYFLTKSTLKEELGDVSFDYYSGWDTNYPLLQHLTSNRESESRIGYTLYGAHRADLRIRVAGKSGAKRLSKGQLKSVAFESIIALHEYISENGPAKPIFLVDDLSAELDNVKQRRLIGKILRLSGQKVLSSIQPDIMEFLDNEGHKVFHVKQGKIT